MTSRRLFLAKLAGLAGFTLLSKAKGDYTKPLSLPVVVPRETFSEEVRTYSGDFGRVNVAIDFDRLLYCISAVESKHDDTVIGPKGERSRYQIKRSVWEQHWGKNRPFSRCSGDAARGTALDHLFWLADAVGPSSPYAFAWSWKEGLDAYLRSHSNRGAMTYGATESSMRGYRYAACVQNLYYDPTYKHA